MIPDQGIIILTEMQTVSRIWAELKGERAVAGSAYDERPIRKY